MSLLGKLKKLFWHYAWGCFAKAWNGAIAAVYGFLGIAAGSALDPDHISLPSWHTAAFIFGTAFLISAIGYFKDNPLPETLGETKPPFHSPPVPEAEKPAAAVAVILPGAGK